MTPRAKPATSKDDAKPWGALDDLRTIIKDARCFYPTEKLVYLAVRILTSNETMETPRVSLQEIADLCGRGRRRKTSGCSKRQVRRALKVAEYNGMIEPLRSKKPGGKEHEKNAYRWHPAVLLEWTRKDRPDSWDLFVNSGGGGDDVSSPPPPVLAARVEEVRIAAGIADHDPHFASLAKRARKADETEERIVRAEARHVHTAARLVERRTEQAKNVATIDADLARLAPNHWQLPTGGGGAPPPSPAPAASPRGGGDDTPSTPPSSGAPPPAPAPASTSALAVRPPTPPVARRPGAAPPLEIAIANPDDEEFAMDVLFFVGRYGNWTHARSHVLAPIEDLPYARMIVESARKGGATPEQVEVAIDRLAFKLHRGDYPNATTAEDLLRLARKFAENQWPTVHAPLPTNILGQLLPPAPADPTDEDLADMRARFGITPERDAEYRAAFDVRAFQAQLVDDGDRGEHRVDAPAGDVAVLLPAARPRAFDLAVEQVCLFSHGAKQWLGSVQFEGLAGGVLSLRALNPFVRDQTQRLLMPRLLEQLGNLGERVAEVRWTDGPIQTPVVK